MDPSSLGFVHRFQAASNPKAARTLLLLHGTGGNESDLFELGTLLAPDANLLGVRGKILEHGAPRFFRRLAEGVFDLEDLHFRTQELIAFITKAVEAYEIDGRLITAVGYSNGANIASSVLLTRPGVLSSAIILRGMVPFTPDPLPNLDSTKVLIASGQLDPIAPPQQAEQLAALLTSANAKVTLQFVNAGHNLTHADLENCRSWLELN